MAQPPVFILAFANDRQGQFLRNIAEEQRAISQALGPLEDRSLLKLKILPDASADDIFDAFRKHNDRVVGFHYGGHADGLELLLSGAQKPLDVSGFAQFLAEQKGLQLVFMNGCATAIQKDPLQMAGIPHLILTETTINDEAARNFATQFYQSLAAGQSADRSFVEAQGATTAQLGNQRGSLTWSYPRQVAKTELPWQFISAPSAQPFALRTRRPSRMPWIAAGAAGLVLLAILAWIFKPAPQPFDLTLIIQDTQGHLLDALARGDKLLLPPNHDLLTDTLEFTKVALVLDGTPRQGETDAQGNVYFRQLDSRFRGKSVPVQISGHYWRTADSSASLTLAPPNQPLRLARTEALCRVWGKLSHAGKPLPGHRVTICALPDASRVLAVAFTGPDGRVSFDIPPDACARQYLIQTDHPAHPYPVRDTIYPESEFILPIN